MENSYNNRLVAVTGATGFIASQLIKQLLEKGYIIHGTVRDNSPSKVEHLLQLPGANERLKLFQADLLELDSFDNAFVGCEGVFHTASPCFNIGGTEENLVQPALEGTQNVLTCAAKYETIKRVILTSSTVSVFVNYGKFPPEYIYTEADWSDVDELREKQSWYALSKTLAEQYAWDFANSSKNLYNFKLIAINPALVLGPMLQPTLNTSSAVLAKFLNGTYKTITNDSKTFVDVRDVAAAHILTYEANEAEGRYLCISTCLSYQTLCEHLRIICPELPVPTELNLVIPSALMGAPPPHHTLYDCRKLTSLGLNFIPIEDTLVETVNSLKKFGFC